MLVVNLEAFEPFADTLQSLRHLEGEFQARSQRIQLALLLHGSGTLVIQSVEEDTFDSAGNERVSLVYEVHVLQQAAVHVDRADQYQTFVKDMRFEIGGHQDVQLKIQNGYKLFGSRAGGRLT